MRARCAAPGVAFLLLLLALLPASAQVCPSASFTANAIDPLRFEPVVVDINSTVAGGANRTSTWWRRLSDGALFAPLPFVATGAALTYTATTVRPHPNVAFCSGDGNVVDPRSRATFFRGARILPRSGGQTAILDQNDLSLSQECSAVPAGGSWGSSICNIWKPAMGISLGCGTCPGKPNYGLGYSSLDLRGTGLSILGQPFAANFAGTPANNIAYNSNNALVNATSDGCCSLWSTPQPNNNLPYPTITLRETVTVRSFPACPSAHFSANAAPSAADGFSVVDADASFPLSNTSRGLRLWMRSVDGALFLPLVNVSAAGAGARLVSSPVSRSPNMASCTGGLRNGLRDERVSARFFRAVRLVLQPAPLPAYILTNDSTFSEGCTTGANGTDNVFGAGSSCEGDRNFGTATACYSCGGGAADATNDAYGNVDVSGTNVSLSPTAFVVTRNASFSTTATVTWGDAASYTRAHLSVDGCCASYGANATAISSSAVLPPNALALREVVVVRPSSSPTATPTPSITPSPSVTPSGSPVPRMDISLDVTSAAALASAVDCTNSRVQALLSGSASTSADLSSWLSGMRDWMAASLGLGGGDVVLRSVTLCGQVLPVPSATATATVTPSATATPTPTSSVVGSASSTPSPGSSLSPTPSTTPTSSDTPTPSATGTPSVTPTPTSTPSSTPSPSTPPTPSTSAFPAGPVRLTALRGGAGGGVPLSATIVDAATGSAVSSSSSSSSSNFTVRPFSSVEMVPGTAPLSTVLLGTFSGWMVDASARTYTGQMFTGGDPCAAAGGAPSAAYVTFECGLAVALLAAEEDVPACVYYLTLAVPEWCGVDRRLGQETSLAAAPSNSPSGSVTPTASPILLSQSPTPTPTASLSPGASASATPSVSPSSSRTPSLSASASPPAASIPGSQPSSSFAVLNLTLPSCGGGGGGGSGGPGAAVLESIVQALAGVFGFPAASVSIGASECVASAASPGGMALRLSIEVRALLPATVPASTNGNASALSGNASTAQNTVLSPIQLSGAGVDEEILAVAGALDVAKRLQAVLEADGVAAVAAVASVWQIAANLSAAEVANVSLGSVGVVVSRPRTAAAASASPSGSGEAPGNMMKASDNADPALAATVASGVLAFALAAALASLYKYASCKGRARSGSDRGAVGGGGGGLGDAENLFNSASTTSPVGLGVSGKKLLSPSAQHHSRSDDGGTLGAETSQLTIRAVSVADLSSAAGGRGGGGSSTRAGAESTSFAPVAV
jgi:hypothetical protein